MERDERQQLRTVSDEIRGWTDLARSVTADRAKVDKAANSAVDTLQRGIVEVPRDGSVAWRVLLLRPNDARRLGEIARQTHLPPLSAGDEENFTRLSSDISAALRDARTVVGARRFFSGARKRDAGLNATQFLTAYRDWGVKTRLPDLLARLTPSDDDRIARVELSDALTDWVGFAPRVAHLSGTPAVLNSSAFAELPEATRTVERALKEEARFRSDAVAAGNAVRRRETLQLLVEMPVERLKDATRDRLRIGPLTDAGITTVQQVLDRGAGLEHLAGIGATTATRMLGAAQTLRQTTYDEMPARIDIKNRIPEAADLLRRLGAWDAVRKAKGATTDLAHADDMRGLARALDRNVSHAIVFPHSPWTVAVFTETAETLVLRAHQICTVASAINPWDDFLARPADYFAMLAELGFITEDEQKTHGDLPDDIVEAVRQVELDTEYLTASLRGYQSFGARFALVQHKVVIGDEMGLGKTVEALAVLAHLRANGFHHSLVVCPAAVVTNWVREVASKSRLSAHRIHGPGRASAARNWTRNGGVAITTFETLGWFEHQVALVHDLGCVVIDEAHYIKNPAAQRSQRACRILDSCGRAVLLTGTPLENRIDEFRNLVGYIRPDLTVDANELSPSRFRRQVAPAYLRRNQEDVLTELPELVEVDEWLPMSREDTIAYRDAVSSGNFMAMRQAGMLQRRNSAKVQRLVEIVQEAEDNGRRVIVFSHFREVLEQVAHTLPGQVFGPLNGSVPAAARQVMVDQFSAAGRGAALVSQIIAGGVGLNIQAASVVVICEPQLKPTTEWQAIARAHRMGQLESVQVHRLLSEEGVDLRVTEILARKREIFNDFARISATAGSAPEALDVSEADLARDVVAAERERLFTHPQPCADEELV